MNRHQTASENESSFDWLPNLLRNVAKYDDGVVSILDRRAYPAETQFVDCSTYEDVAQAIRDMVTQSSGPVRCAGLAMVLACRSALERSDDPVQILETVRDAAAVLASSRPTHDGVKRTVSHIAAWIEDRLPVLDDLEYAVEHEADRLWFERQQKSLRKGEVAATLMRDGGTLLTHCWAESGIAYAVHAALQMGKKLDVYCTETRPYFQGSKLTADALSDLGISATIITDSTPASLMQKGQIDLVITGSDRVAADGSLVNKIGTLPIALAARYFKVPMYAFTHGADPTVATGVDVPIELRDPNEITHIFGRRIATDKANALYPAFDITPAELVSGYITDAGMVSPKNVPPRAHRP